MPAPCMSVTGTKFFAGALRVFSVLLFLSGILIVALPQAGPTENALTAGFWVLGFLSVVTAVVGFISAARQTVRCCLGSFLVLSGLLLICQGGFVLYLFMSPEEAIDTLVGSDATPEHWNKVHDAVFIGRWVLLGLIAAEIAACVLAMCLRCCVWRQDRYDAFVDENQEYETHKSKVQKQMDKLKADTFKEGGQSKASIKSINISTYTPGQFSNPAPLAASSSSLSGKYTPKLAHAEKEGVKLAGYLQAHAPSPVVVPPLVSHAEKQQLAGKK